MRALYDRADHNARSAGLARHLHHGRVADGEGSALAEYRGERLRVAAGRRDIQLEAVLLEDVGALPYIKVDVSKVVHRLDEVDFLDLGRGSRDRAPCDSAGDHRAD